MTLATRRPTRYAVPAPAVRPQAVRAVDWRDLGACTSQDPDLFFPIGTGAIAEVQAAAAKAVCRRCPVMAACREWALDHPKEASAGVWGGASEQELKSARSTRTHQRYRAGIRQAENLVKTHGDDIRAWAVDGQQSTAPIAERLGVPESVLAAALRMLELTPPQVVRQSDRPDVEKVLASAARIRHLRASGATVRSIADEFGVSRQTMGRALTALAERDEAAETLAAAGELVA